MHGEKIMSKILHFLFGTFLILAFIYLQILKYSLNFSIMLKVLNNFQGCNDVNEHIAHPPHVCEIYGSIIALTSFLA